MYLEGESGLENEDREAGGLTDEPGAFSDIPVWFCVHLNAPLSERKTFCRSKNVHFSSATVVCNHSTAFSVHPRPLKVYTFQICGTYTSS